MSITQRIGHETGFATLAKSSRDVKLLCLQRLIRLVAYGLSALILIAFLSSCDIEGAWIGAFLTLTLVGDLILSLILTLVADRIGRRRILLLGCCLMTASGIMFVMTTNYWVLLLASVFGVISPR